jgi:hypothetical protein
LVDPIALAIQVDDFSDFTEFSARNDTELETMTASTWARRQFWTSRLLDCKVDPAIKPFDGFDKMFLLAWLHKRLSEFDTAPFVLHYWDLRMPNIIIDNDNNIAG